MKEFDVALWHHWPSRTFPVVQVVEASSAFAAVELVMRMCEMRWAGHVAARALDGSICYRGYRVLLVEAARVQVVQQRGQWMMEAGEVTMRELLYAWGSAHRFPELRWPIPDFSGVMGVTQAGEEAWRLCRDQGLPQYVRAAYWTAMSTTRV